MIVLDCYNARKLVEGNKLGEDFIEVSLNLGLTSSTISIKDQGWLIDDLKKIARLVDNLDNIHLFMLCTYPNELPL